MKDKPGGFVVAYDGHVTQSGDEYQRIDRDVSDDVDDVVHQAAGQVTKRPVGRGELVGSQRRHEDDEYQITHGHVEQQQVGVGTHARPRHYDVDDQRVAKDADERYEVEQDWDDDHVQNVLEVLAPFQSQQFIRGQFAASIPRLISDQHAREQP